MVMYFKKIWSQWCGSIVCMAAHVWNYFIGVPFNRAFIQNTGVDAFKAFIKKKITAAAHVYLTTNQAKHSKVSDIKYEILETQPYLMSSLFSDTETKLLTALRSRMHESFKKNFSQMHGGQVDCPLTCWRTNAQPVKDSQEHLLTCKPITERFQTKDIAEDVQYSDLFNRNVKKRSSILIFFLYFPFFQKVQNVT